jgi:hypothetical protein
MKNNNIDIKQIININKNKYLFIGFIIGIIPFILVLTICSIVSGNIREIPLVFRNTIIIFGLLTSISNAFIFKSMFISKLKEFSNL